MESPPVAGTATTSASLPLAWNTAAAVLAAGVASTLHRIRRGEGALLAVNLSLIVHQGLSLPRSLAQALVSVLALGLMYAFNDLYDAPTDSNNPKKDQALIATYLEHRRVCALSIFVLKLLTLVISFAALGVPATVALTAVMLVNVLYSTRLKGVPVIDVAWCGLWGALFAAIVGAPPALLVLVGLMTSVCHLYQALDDRVADAANGITTTAVQSRVLSRNVLCALTLLLFAVLRVPFGDAWALTAFTPLVLFFTADNPRTGWLLTKVYFGVAWIHLLGIDRATG